MKIAIDISPLQSGHKVRGVGFYLEYLKRSLLENFPEHNYLFFSSNKELTKDIDIVHYPYFDPFFTTLPLSLKYKTVVTVHDLTPLVFPKHFPSGLKGSLRWQRQKFLLKKVNAVIADSEASKKDIVRIAGISEEKVFVVHLAAGKEFREKDQNELKKSNVRGKYNLPEKFALYVGDVTWNKNVPRLIQAALISGMPLVIVGKALAELNYDRTNPWNHDLVTAQNLIKNNKNIHVLGFLPTEELIDLYNLASVFVFPSIYEGFGLPVLEAMQSGCPVVTTKNGSLVEVAENAAFYVDGKDMQSIASGMMKIVNSTNLQQELSKKGLEQAKKFSWKKTAQESVNVYEKVLSL